MRLTVFCLATACLAALASLAYAQPPTSFVNKLGVEIDVRSGSRVLLDNLNASGFLLPPDDTTSEPGGPTVPQIQLRDGNVQVNDPNQNYIQIFPCFRPFVHST